ncbi:nitronate monooxygenase [Antrihabitans sp. YC3-6]|uniref:Probable nitronate monooxygenase n=1 Tax=Antrihabitans stalagmiti TaxID=2799499 RepID=A0A934NQX8_9NOCA|nr:nitronate monooxygenase [Antrihabitans stalagmiti]MBJ8339670.1 nitronate monooxygenase [Antrihabitans stalagmiti]
MTGTWAGRLGDVLGLEHPIVQGPFGGGLSSVELLAAVSNAGGLGSFGAHIFSPGEIGDIVASARAVTDKPFAINLWVPHVDDAPRPTIDELAQHIDRLRPYYEQFGVDPPDPDTMSLGQNYPEQIEALLEFEPPAISFVMGIPDAHVVAEARRRGIVTIATATTVAEAVAVETAGIDVVVASGSDAGGHRGAFLSPLRESLVGTFSLVPAVADAVGIPVVAAGGIADGRGVAAALTLGADAVQIGTGFLTTTESGTHPVHKAALLGPDAGTTVLTRLFSGRHARGIPNGFVRDLAALEDEVPAYPIQNALMQPIRKEAGRQGNPDFVNLWAGQAATLSRGGSAAAYVDRLVTTAQAVLGR